MITIGDILPRLENVQEKGGNQWMASCPCGFRHRNGDRNRSLHITLEGDKILLHCFTGCSQEEVLDALGMRSVASDKSEADKRSGLLSWYAQKNGLTLIEEYSYCYGEYQDGLTKVRFQNAEGKKTFCWIRKDNSKPSGYSMGTKGCRNRLYVSGSMAAPEIFLVEGEKDANTVHRITGGTAASAANGATGAGEDRKWLPEYTQQLKGKKVYILWDNDEVGRAWADRQASELSEVAEVYKLDLFTVWTDAPEKADVSDMARLHSDSEMETILRNLQNAAAPENDPPQVERSSADLMDDFLMKITGDGYKPLPTGLQTIDAAIGGGLMRQTLVLLGAEPGAGKTALTTMIFEQMAKDGTPCLYFNLEMSREQLFARSLSRIIYRQTGSTLYPIQILQGYKHTQQQRETVIAAAEWYKDNVAPCMKYNPDRTTSEIENILDIITEEAEKAAATGVPAPIVCIDYLHLLTSREKIDAGEILKRAVYGLKEYARKYDTVVFCIMAQSRAANNSKDASLSSGRDTSALEYSADLQLQLLKDGEDDEQSGEFTFTNMVVTKNRFGVASLSKKYRFRFYGGLSLFEPIDRTHEEPFRTLTPEEDKGNPFDKPARRI